MGVRFPLGAQKGYDTLEEAQETGLYEQAGEEEKVVEVGIAEEIEKDERKHQTED